MMPSRTSSAGAEDLLVAAIGRAAQVLTPEAMRTIAAQLDLADVPGPGTQATMRDTIPNTSIQQHAVRIVKRWESEAPESLGRDVARCVRAAADTAQRFAAEYDLRLVITGPDTPVVPVRSTRAVVREIVEGAEERALLVTFAVWPDAEVFAALRAVAKKGVRVDLVRETWWPDNPAPDHAGDIAEAVNLWHWPTPRDGNARMHAKVTVVDEYVALVSSANLTGAAMDRNIETGVLVRGGTLPRTLSRHYMNLISTGELKAG